MTSIKTTLDHRKGSTGRLLSVFSVLALLCMVITFFASSQKLSIASHRKLASSLSKEHAAVNMPREVSPRNFNDIDEIHTRPTLRAHAYSRSKRQNTTRRLPGEYPNFDFNDPAMASAIVFIAILLLLLCCCRGMLCDILACVCLYEMCCDDGVVGGFDLMPGF